MKAVELLRLYEAGKRDFRGETLRGQTFKGKDLSGADFSRADIRGTNFTNATLKEASFVNAKAGLQRQWGIVLLMIVLLLLGLSSFFSGAISGALVEWIINPTEIGQRLVSWLVIVITIVFWAIAVGRGVVASLGFAAVAFAVAFASAFTSAVASAGVGTSAFAVAVAGTVAFVVAGTVAFAIKCTVTVTFTVAFAVACAVARAVDCVGALTFAVTSAVAGTVAFAVAGTVAGTVAFTFTGAVASAMVMSAVSAYIGWRALRGDERDMWIRAVAVAFAAMGGTSFRGADLTDADFTQAQLKNTDLSRATLTRTNWHQAKKLDRTRAAETILMNPTVRDLVITHRGQGKSYVDCNLQGANLMGADLSDADLKEADISQATLEGAWLERANLSKTQALGTDFHQANLTGACLESWNIDSTTQLDGAICEYVYLLDNHKERRPNSGTFAPGEFTKLFEEVLDTIDLIFRNGLDWKAFVTAFGNVRVENGDTEIDIQSIENKGDGVMVVKLQASPDADKDQNPPVHDDRVRHCAEGHR